MDKRHGADAFAVTARKQHHYAPNALDDYENVLSAAYLVSFGNDASPKSKIQLLDRDHWPKWECVYANFNEEGILVMFSCLKGEEMCSEDLKNSCFGSNASFELSEACKVVPRDTLRLVISVGGRCRRPSRRPATRVQSELSLYKTVTMPP